MDMNPFEILKNTQKIREQMAVMQQRLGTIIVTGSAGGGMAQIDMNGRMEVLAVRLAPEAVNSDDIPLLQDLIKAAFTDAMDKVKETLQGEFGGMAGSMGIDPGMLKF